MSVLASLPDPLKYRGWTISQPHWPEPWLATGPNYDASWEGEETGYVDNGEKAEAKSYELLLDEINTWFEEDAIRRDREQIQAWLPSTTVLFEEQLKSLGEKIVRGEHWKGVAELVANG